MRQFYLHPRNGTFYVEFVDPGTGLRLSARSTGTKNRDEALLKVAEWLKSGIPNGRKHQKRLLENAVGIENILKSIRKTDLDPDDAMRIVSVLKERELIDLPIIRRENSTTLFIDFLELFWTYEKSPYVKEKLAHRHNIGKRHCYDSLCRLHRHWKEPFKDRPLNSITKADLKDFSLSLSDKGLASATINKTMSVGITALKWAFQDGKIVVDPTIGLIGFSGKAKKRGVLTPQEAAVVFSIKWKDKRAYIGNMVACTTGLRSGEVLSLQKDDIEEKVLNIRHSWNDFDGQLKSTKTTVDRKVPLLPEVKAKLFELIDENPHGEDGLFIFYDLFKDKPMSDAVLLDGLKASCKEVGNNPSGWTTNVSIPKSGKDGVLWMIKGEKDKKGDLKGDWSDPIQMTQGEIVEFEQKSDTDNFIEVRYKWALQKPEKPMVIDTVSRGIVFHSHRHYYAARMVDRMTAEQVKRLTGHKSLAVFENYADHIISENLEAARAVSAEIFKNVLTPLNEEG
jgi:integrase